MRHIHPFAGALLLSCFAAGLPAADEIKVPVDVYQAPKPISMGGPGYPSSQSHLGNEGWVHVNFMISPKGEPYEIAVVESTGIEAFERAAINAVKNWKFEPATLDGTAIDAGQNVKLLFMMREPARGASSEFVRAYKALAKAIEADDRAKADEALAKLRVDNLYEDAFKNLSNFRYHQKWGTESQQILDLRRAIAREDQPRYLKKDLFTWALDTLLLLELKSQDFAGAQATWKRLQSVGSKAVTAKWERPMEEVASLKTSDRPFLMKAHIEKGTSWYGKLYKNRFEIRVSSGQVSEIKLRCEKKYVFFPYEPDLQYTVDSRHGDCGIEVVGTPDTKFELIQS
jgi:TonB family protein